MKHLLPGLAALAVAAAVAAGPAKAQRVLTLETYAGPNHAVNAAGLTLWAQQVEQASGGDLKINITYPPVDPRDLMDRVRNGIGDIAWMTHGYTTGRFVFTDMIELPGSGGNAEVASRAYWRVYTEEIGMREHRGVTPLALFTHGPGMIHTARPITAGEQFKGLRIRTGGGIQAAIANGLGLVTVSAPVTKAQEMLSQGVADGVMFSIETIKSFNLGDLVTHHYHFPGNLYGSSMAIIINTSVLEGLTEAQRQALWSVSGEHLSGLIGSAWDGADKVAIDAFGADSVTVMEGDVLAAVQAATAGLDEAWYARAREAGLENPEAVLARLRAEVAAQMPGN
ncbi:MAG: TRAP transporter substrate-binding protein [Rhodobacteraceae bacterium]|jgi:TRAP-type C4-dicarboxylate transport system substrate-binding protein|nr:TRAP transporter substrate-binding protein [Paracoccaceae bacterium]